MESVVGDELAVMDDWCWLEDLDGQPVDCLHGDLANVVGRSSCWLPLDEDE